MAEWLTTWEQAVVYWPDAPGDDEGLATYLIAAREACQAYAPALAEGAPLPEAWVLAQALQARNIWNSGAAAAGGGGLCSPPPRG